MKRRNKEEMSQMRDLVEYYLILNKYNPHVAYDNYIKEYLSDGKMLPYFIKGLKDFIKIAEEMKNKKLVESTKADSQLCMEELKVKLINKYKGNMCELNNLIKENKENSVYSSLIELWMTLQDDTPNISNGLYMKVRDVI